MRLAIAITLCTIAAAGCGNAEGGGPRTWFSRGGERAYATSAGDAALDPGGLLSFEVTSDLYRRWIVVQQEIGRTPTGRSVTQLGRRSLGEQELEEAVARVQQDARARAAIERAGMTAREYVYATVAIEQAMAVASGRLAPRKGGAGEGLPGAEVAGSYREPPLPGTIMGDTGTIVMPSAPLPPAIPEPVPAPPSETLPPTVPTLPEPSPTPSPVPEPMPIPAPTRIPEPMPTEPRSDTLREPPSQAPRPAPEPAPLPVPSPQPAQPTPTTAPTAPSPPPSPPDTSPAGARGA